MNNDCKIRFGHHGACSLGRVGCVTDHEALALGRRLMTIPGYVPAHGMIDVEGRTCDVVLNGQVWTADDVVPLAEFIPDLGQGATRGELLDQVRDVLGDPLVHVQPLEFAGVPGVRWAAVNGRGKHVSPLFKASDGAWVCTSEAEALVLAREVAS